MPVSSRVEVTFFTTPGELRQIADHLETLAEPTEQGNHHQVFINLGQGGGILMVNRSDPQARAHLSTVQPEQPPILVPSSGIDPSLARMVRTGVRNPPPKPNSGA